MAEELVIIDAKTFQEPLGKLAETMAQKVRRDGPECMHAPGYVCDDLFMMIRQSLRTYDLMFYLNAEERIGKDCYWRNEYGVVTATVVRSMIDCFYNITAILEDPAATGRAYRKSGFRKALEGIAEDARQYSGIPEWMDFLGRRKTAITLYMRMSEITEGEAMAQAPWPTMGAYIRSKPDTAHKEFLRKFTYLEWRQYSALAHAAFEAYIGQESLGAYFISDEMSHEYRPRIEENYPKFMTRHIARAALILLCTVTEIQARCRFEGANINDRICKVWNTLRPLAEAKELLDGRYAALMTVKKIWTE